MFVYPDIIYPLLYIRKDKINDLFNIFVFVNEKF